MELSEVIATARLELLDPTTQTEPRFVLGLYNIFCCFFPRFSRAAAPMNKKLRKDQSTSLPLVIPAKKDAVGNVKTLLKTPFKLALPRVKGQYIVDTNTCNSQVWRMLQQQKIAPPDKMGTAHARSPVRSRSCQLPMRNAWPLYRQSHYCDHTRGSTANRTHRPRGF